MANTPRLDTVSPKRQRIAELARQAPEMVFTSLAHHIDRDVLAGFKGSSQHVLAGVRVAVR